MVRLVVIQLVVFLGLCLVQVDLSQAQPPQVAQDEFVPLEAVPLEDQLPAAPLLITAYAIIWTLVFVYLWSIWRRMSVVESELENLSQRTDTSNQSR
jgi:CcmD family protein